MYACMYVSVYTHKNIHTELCTHTLDFDEAYIYDWDPNLMRPTSAEQHILPDYSISVQ